MNQLTRRRALQVGLAGTLTLGTQFSFGARSSAPLLRLNVMSSSYTQMPDFINGVKVMKSRQDNDPLSWRFQANTHGTPPGTPIPVNSQGVWDTCEHSSWYFLPWHRVYLYYFERILRAASGNNQLTLPYWDWASRRSIPDAFYNDPLNENRDLQLGDELKPVSLGPTGPVIDPVNQSYALSRANYGDAVKKLLQGSTWQWAGFTWQLEMLPHNIIHSLIGGLMGDPATAAQDPIFWLHHCNIDRLWNSWLSNGEHTNPTDFAWLDQIYAFYDLDPVDSTKAIRVEKTLRDHLVLANTSAQYDSDIQMGPLLARLAVPPDNRTEAEREAAKRQRTLMMAQPPLKPVAASKPRPWELGTEPLHVDVDITSEPARQTLSHIAAATSDTIEKSKTFLVIKGIKAALQNVIALRQVPKILSTYWNLTDRYDKTAWALFNAFTSVLGPIAQRNPNVYAAKTIRLNSLLLPRSAIAEQQEASHALAV